MGFNILTLIVWRRGSDVVSRCFEENPIRRDAIQFDSIHSIQPTQNHSATPYYHVDQEKANITHTS